MGAGKRRVVKTRLNWAVSQTVVAPKGSVSAKENLDRWKETRATSRDVHSSISPESHSSLCWLAMAVCPLNLNGTSREVTEQHLQTYCNESTYAENVFVSSSPVHCSFAVL